MPKITSNKKYQNALPSSMNIGIFNPPGCSSFQYWATRFYLERRATRRFERSGDSATRPTLRVAVRQGVAGGWWARRGDAVGCKARHLSSAGHLIRGGRAATTRNPMRVGAGEFGRCRRQAAGEARLRWRPAGQGAGCRWSCTSGSSCFGDTNSRAREMPAPFNCALPPSVPLIRFLNVAACLHRWTPTPLRCALTPPSFILGARLIKLRTKLLHVLLNRMQMVCSQCSEVREMTLFMPKRMLS